VDVDCIVDLFASRPFGDAVADQKSQQTISRGPKERYHFAPLRWM
jgi:hypothetical protein